MTHWQILLTANWILSPWFSHYQKSNAFNLLSNNSVPCLRCEHSTGNWLQSGHEYNDLFLRKMIAQWKVLLRNFSVTHRKVCSWYSLPRLTLFNSPFSSRILASVSPALWEQHRRHFEGNNPSCFLGCVMGLPGKPCVTKLLSDIQCTICLKIPCLTTGS